MRKIFWFIIIAIIGFLVIYGVIPEVKSAVNDGLSVAGGQTYVALSGFAGAIAANPIYQTYHVLIWLVGGAVLLYSLQRLWKKHKIPILQKAQPSASLPTVVEVRAATPPYATSRPTPEAAAEVQPPPVEPTKKTAEETA